jgi:uncharacterized protein YbjT (DUF2867 family)
MTPTGGRRPVLLVVGGCGGLVGRAVLEEFSPDHEIRSVHRHEAPAESERGVRWIRSDVAAVEDWAPLLAGVDTVLTLAWYRQGPARRFRRLAAGLVRLIGAAERAGVGRFAHVSVPEAPERMERDLPYLALKRTVDRALASSRLAYTIVRPTMLFGERDKLLTVMLRTMARYRRFPMFGDGSYHVSPVASRDLARILRRESSRGARNVVDVGGAERWVYRTLTDRMFGILGLPPRYVSLSARNSVRLAAVLERLGSSRLYAYEVEWLLSDRLGVPTYQGLADPLEPVEPFLRRQAAGLRSGVRSPAA